MTCDRKTTLCTKVHCAVITITVMLNHRHVNLSIAARKENDQQHIGQLHHQDVVYDNQPQTYTEPFPRHNFFGSIFLADFFRYLHPNISGAQPWPFSVTWPFDTPGAISYRCFFVTESLYFQPFLRYWAPNISVSSPWPFKVTWCHLSPDHSTRHMTFCIDVPLDLSLYLLTVFKIFVSE